MKVRPALTEKMAEVIKMRQDGKSYSAIARATDRQITGVKSVLIGVVKKLEKIGVYTDQRECHKYSHQLLKPKIKDTQTERLLADAEMPAHHRRNLERRIKSLNFPNADEVDKIDPAFLPKMLGEKATMLMAYIDHFAAASANLKDLTGSLEKVIHVKQLLEGQPTHILGHERRQKVNELVLRVVEEAKRRGITLPGEFTVEND